MTGKINDGGPAFPCETIGTDDHGEYRIPAQGMSLRDYFAAKVLQGLMASPNLQVTDYMRIAEDAYEQADAMLKARES